MGKFEDLQALGIPVIAEVSQDSFSFAPMTDEQWEIVYTVIGGWDRIRRRRFELLSECDWTQLPDAVLTLQERQAWQDYRQALRDIPQDFATPQDVIFPVKP